MNKLFIKLKIIIINIYNSILQSMSTFFSSNVFLSRAVSQLEIIYNKRLGDFLILLSQVIFSKTLYYIELILYYALLTWWRVILVFYFFVAVYCFILATTFLLCFFFDLPYFYYFIYLIYRV